ncbi:MAG: response regulator [Desulfobulbaceae bacterium]|nr:response regulator [Desulfobulbaceae bacterium]
MTMMSILVADDDPIIRKLFNQLLKDAGYEVTVAVDGIEAARFLDHTHFDVVVTDLVMPGNIGGIELLQITKEKDINTEIIVITAHSSIDTAVDAMKKGAFDYLEKPVNFDELFLRLEKIAQVKSLVRNAGDLREAMDVTEHSAAQTIQDLEIAAGDMQLKLDRLENILLNQGINESERIHQALEEIHS